MNYFKGFMRVNWMIWSIWMVVNFLLVGIPIFVLFGYCVENPSWWLITLNVYSCIGMIVVAYDDEGGRDSIGKIEKWIYKKDTGI